MKTIVYDIYFIFILYYETKSVKMSQWLITIFQIFPKHFGVERSNSKKWVLYCIYASSNRVFVFEDWGQYMPPQKSYHGVGYNLDMSFLVSPEFGYGVKGIWNKI